MDWYTAGTILEKQRQQGVDTSQVATIPFFENLFPTGLASIVNDFFGLDPVCCNSDPNPGFIQASALENQMICKFSSEIS